MSYSAVCTACGISAAAAATAPPPAGSAAGAAYCTDGVDVHACVGRSSPLRLAGYYTCRPDVTAGL